MVSSLSEWKEKLISFSLDIYKVKSWRKDRCVQLMLFPGSWHLSHPVTFAQWKWVLRPDWFSTIVVSKRIAVYSPAAHNCNVRAFMLGFHGTTITRIHIECGGPRVATDRIPPPCLNPLRIQTLQYVLRLGKSQIQLPPPLWIQTQGWGEILHTNSWCWQNVEFKYPPPCLNPDLHRHTDIYTMVIAQSALRIEQAHAARLKSSRKFPISPVLNFMLNSIFAFHAKF